MTEATAQGRDYVAGIVFIRTHEMSTNKKKEKKIDSNKIRK